jgi:hypothetical protein
MGALQYMQQTGCFATNLVLHSDFDEHQKSPFYRTGCKGKQIPEIVIIANLQF